MIYRFDSPLFFANANTFRDRVLRLANDDPRPRWILIAAEPITDIDTTAADMLEDLDHKLNADGISLVFAELKTRSAARSRSTNWTDVIDPAHFFPTITEAIHAYRDQTGSDWTARPSTDH